VVFTSSIVLGPAGDVIPIVSPGFRYAGFLYTASSSLMAATDFFRGKAAPAISAPVVPKKLFLSILDTNYLFSEINAGMQTFIVCIGDKQASCGIFATADWQDYNRRLAGLLRIFADLQSRITES
jgi:hypothetical protein